MAKRILISFKETEEDMKLYEEIMKHSNVSGYIKDILKGLIKNNGSYPMVEIPKNYIFDDEEE